MGAVELQGFALCLVRGAGLVKLGFAVPLHPEFHPTVWALPFEVVLDRALAPDPVAHVVVAVWLLDSRASF